MLKPEQRRQKQYTFLSPLSYCITNFVAEKEGMNKRSPFTLIHLKRLDELAMLYDLRPNELPESLVKEWIKKHSYESNSTHKMRFWLIRQLGEYMRRCGYEAFVSTEKTTKANNNKFTPYILSDIEIKKIMCAADALQKTMKSPLKHIVIPMLFRVLFCCGLRLSEATHLKVGDVTIDSDTVILNLTKTKFDKERLLPLSPSLSASFKVYFETIHRFSKPDMPVFPSNDGWCYSNSTIYELFRRFLRESAISHGGRGKGPRIHDIRHTFAVKCLKKWVLNGEDMLAVFPLLSTYMGHVNLSSTSVYLRLTADLFPHIVSKTEERFGDIVPLLAEGVRNG